MILVSACQPNGEPGSENSDTTEAPFAQNASCLSKSQPASAHCDCIREKASETSQGEAFAELPEDQVETAFAAMSGAEFYALADSALSIASQCPPKS